MDIVSLVVGFVSGSAISIALFLSFLLIRGVL